MLTGENQSTRTEIRPSATLRAANLTWSDLGSKLGFHGKMPATTFLSYGTVPDDGSTMFQHKQQNVNTHHPYAVVRHSPAIGLLPAPVVQA